MQKYGIFCKIIHTVLLHNSVGQHTVLQVLHANGVPLHCLSVKADVFVVFMSFDLVNFLVKPIQDSKNSSLGSLINLSISCNGTENMRRLWRWRCVHSRIETSFLDIIKSADAYNPSASHTDDRSSDEKLQALL